MNKDILFSLPVLQNKFLKGNTAQNLSRFNLGGDKTYGNNHFISRKSLGQRFKNATCVNYAPVLKYMDLEELTCGVVSISTNISIVSTAHFESANGFYKVYAISESENLWNKYYSIIGTSEQKALIFLYGSLIDMTVDAHNCEKFLIYSMDLPLSTDESIHIINAFAPIRDKLKNWNSFLDKCKPILFESLGEKVANRILKYF